MPLGHRSTSPTIRVTASPDTHTCPSTASSRTRPSRPMTLPWREVYDDGSAPVPISYWASPALALPVTGSSPNSRPSA